VRDQDDVYAIESRSTSVGAIARRQTMQGRPVPRWDLDTPSTDGKRFSANRVRT
jgi:hypothetical protein